MPQLFIGATGMLAAAAANLADKANGKLVMMARKADAFRFGQPQLDQRLAARNTDWSDAPDFLSALEEVGAEHGPFKNVLVWMHGRDELLRAQITHHVAEGGTLVEVLGSAASRPGAFGDIRVQQMQANPHVRYRQLLLGFIHQHGTSRWLTHAEIGSGVLDAFAADTVTTVAGQVEPWNLRP